MALHSFKAYSRANGINESVFVGSLRVNQDCVLCDYHLDLRSAEYVRPRRCLENRHIPVNLRSLMKPGIVKWIYYSWWNCYYSTQPSCWLGIFICPIRGTPVLAYSVISDNSSSLMMMVILSVFIHLYVLTFQRYRTRCPFPVSTHGPVWRERKKTPNQSLGFVLLLDPMPREARQSPDGVVVVVVYR